MAYRIPFGICDFFLSQKIKFEQKLLMGILLAYRRMWCYSQRQGATGRGQCSSSSFLCSQWRQKNYKRNGKALNFSIQLWNAPWRSIRGTDPGEACLPRPRLVCVNPWFFGWLPVTLCFGNTATESRTGFIQRTPKWKRVKAALMLRDTGTECGNGRRMNPEGKGACARFCYFTDGKYILSLSSTCSRASHAAVTCRWFAQPAVVHHWVSSTQYGSWWGSHSYQHLQTFIPVTPWGCLWVFVPFWSILREVT